MSATGSMPNRGWKDPSAIHAASGALSGIFTAVFVCPLDVLKTRIQVQCSSNVKYRSIIGGLVSMVKEEGIRSAYRGLTPTILALLPTWALYFSAYEHIKTTITKSPTWSKMPATSQYVTASIGAGMLNVVVTNPLWVVKTRLQTQNLALQYAQPPAHMYRGTFDALRTILLKEGPRGLYSGLAPSLIGIGHVAIQFPLYESLKTGAAAWRGVARDALPASDLMLLSSIAKMVASVATYPHEVVRSHMHVSGSGAFAGLVTICAQIARDEGLRGFYRGCLTNLVRTTPAAAITFTSYEVIRRNLTAAVELLDSQATSSDTPTGGSHSSVIAVPSSDLASNKM